MNEADLALFAKVVPLLMIFGAVLKHALPKFPNRAIPLLTLPVGVAAFCKLSGSWSADAAFDGFAAFLLSTGLHSGLKNLFFGSGNDNSGDGAVPINKGPILALALLVSVVSAPLALTGCANHPKDPKAVAFLTLADTWAGVKAGMVLHTDAYARGEIDEATREKIDGQYVKFRLAFLAALRLAKFQWTTATPDGVTVLASELLASLDHLNL